jgi:acylphosphatase
VWIRGRVQNVWFRDGCAREAERLGVAGWVTNRPDGGVEAVFEGAPAAVAAIEAWCGRGPTRARVEHVEARTESPTGERGFVIR